VATIPAKVTARIKTQVTLNNDGTRFGKGTTSYVRELNLKRIWESSYKSGEHAATSSWCASTQMKTYTQALGKMLTNPEGLGMVEAVGAYTGKKIGPTYFRGQKPIDGIWTTPDITIANACVMPAGYGIGDH
jgi:hypothetical protein